jgi:hypothetical protein
MCMIAGLTNTKCIYHLARAAIGTNVKKFVLGGDLPEEVRDKLKRAQPKVGHHVEFVN